MKLLAVLLLFGSKDWGDPVQPSMTWGVVTHIAWESPLGVNRQFVALQFPNKGQELTVDGRNHPFVKVGDRLRICKHRAIYRRDRHMIGGFL